MTNLYPALLRAVRTFVQAFLALYPAPMLIGAAGGTEPFDLGLARSAAAAAAAAVIALVWNAILDPSRVPSLRVPTA